MNHITPSRPKRWKYRLLSVGCDHALTLFLKEELKHLDCFVVSCPRGTEARILIESELPYIGGSAIKYSLFLFNEELPDMTGKELAQFAGSVWHRKQTPILIVKKSDDWQWILNQIKRRLV